MTILLVASASRQEPRSRVDRQSRVQLADIRVDTVRRRSPAEHARACEAARDRWPGAVVRGHRRAVTVPCDGVDELAALGTAHSLALPMFVILALQAAGVALFASLVTFRVMGANYEAAALVAGQCGFGLGATPTAIANLQAISARYGYAPQAFILVPIVGAFPDRHRQRGHHQRFVKKVLHSAATDLNRCHRRKRYLCFDLQRENTAHQTKRLGPCQSNVPQTLCHNMMCPPPFSQDCRRHDSNNSASASLRRRPRVSLPALTEAPHEKLTPDEIIALMKKGNNRSATERNQPHNPTLPSEGGAKGQRPSASSLSCIDSRAPAETIMDFGIGGCFDARMPATSPTTTSSSHRFEYKLAGAKVLFVMGLPLRRGRGCDRRCALGRSRRAARRGPPRIEVAQSQRRALGQNYGFVDAVARKNVELTMADIRRSQSVLGRPGNFGRDQDCRSDVRPRNGRSRVPSLSGAGECQTVVSAHVPDRYRQRERHQRVRKLHSAFAWLKSVR